jgi:hypothetical protein
MPVWAQAGIDSPLSELSIVGGLTGAQWHQAHLRNQSRLHSPAFNQIVNEAAKSGIAQ